MKQNENPDTEERTPCVTSDIINVASQTTEDETNCSVSGTGIG